MFFACDSNSNETVSDVSDLASIYELSYTDEAIKRVRIAGKPQTSPNFDGKNCIKCGETIFPLERVSLGYQVCLYCQTKKDKRFHRTNT